MWISVRTETASGHRRAAFIGPAGGCVRVSQGTVSIQRCRTLPSELATTGFISRAVTEDQDTGTLFQLARERIPRKEKRIKRLRPCSANRNTVVASYRLLPHFSPVSRCSLCSQAENRHLPPLGPTEEVVLSYSPPRSSL